MCSVVGFSVHWRGQCGGHTVVGTWAVLEGKVGISSSPAWTLHRAHILLNKHTHLIHVLGTLYIYVFYFLNEIIYHLNFKFVRQI